MNFEDKRFYVYCHCFKDTNEIFYIGKGTNMRHSSTTTRSSVWKDVTHDREYYTLKIRENLTNHEAFNLEHELLEEFHTKGNVQRKSNRVKKIDYDVVSESVEYDASSRTFLRWKRYAANNAMKPGDVAGSYDGEGYGQISIFGVMYKIHRVVWCLFSGQDLYTNDVIDHIDRNKSNNLINNLRLVSYSDNAKNVDWSIVKPTNTQERAVSLREGQKLYRVCWTENRKVFEERFSFNPRGERAGSSTRYSPDRESALNAAIKFRDILFQEGKII